MVTAIKYLFQRKGPSTETGNLFQKRGLLVQISLIYIIYIRAAFPHCTYASSIKKSKKTKTTTKNTSHKIYYSLV